jgi:hypothetical protein
MLVLIHKLILFRKIIRANQKRLNNPLLRLWEKTRLSPKR